MHVTSVFVDEILWCYHSNESLEQCFPVVPFIMRYKVVLTFESLDGATIQMKAPKQYFPVILFVVLIFESVDKI